MVASTSVCLYMYIHVCIVADDGSWLIVTWQHMFPYLSAPINNYMYMYAEVSVCRPSYAVVSTYTHVQAMFII